MQNVRIVTCRLVVPNSYFMYLFNLEQIKMIEGSKYVNVCTMNKKCKRRHWRKTFGICGTNCNLRHNLHSTIGMLALNLRSRMNDTVHWPRQNYNKDHVANVCGKLCGCGREWRKDMKLHQLSTCAWMNRMGDVINAGYDKANNEDLNTVNSYCEFAIKTACRCIPSWSLLKHGWLANRNTTVFGHDLRTRCEFGESSCKRYCSACVHYCGISHGA